MGKAQKKFFITTDGGPTPDGHKRRKTISEAIKAASEFVRDGESDNFDVWEVRKVASVKEIVAPLPVKVTLYK